MRYHNITTDDMLNGEGLRVVLWVSGCTHQCPGCHNSITWDIDGGIPFDAAAKTELLASLSKEYIHGITFSGGDPLHPANIAEIGSLIQEIKKSYPEKTIWLYTGFLWEHIFTLPFIPMIDVIVDGKYIEALKDAKKHWAGSSNQQIIDVKKSLFNNSVVLYEPNE